MGVSMYSVSYRDLHKEHMNWISSIKIWKDEIIFLHNSCNSQNHSPNIANLKEINIDISHHQRLLDNMESQIHSHESFIKEMLDQGGEDFEESSATDHDHNREHMESFKKSVNRLKKKVFKFSSHRLH